MVTTRSRAKDTKVPSKDAPGALPTEVAKDAPEARPTETIPEPPEEEILPTPVGNDYAEARVIPVGPRRKSRPARWLDESYLPLPDEVADYDDALDLISDARDAIVAGRLERGREPDKGPSAALEPLPSPLTVPELLEAQAHDEFFQTVHATHVGIKGTHFFEDSDGVLCRAHPREPELTQIVLPSALRHRTLRLAHYHELAGHPGQTRLHRRLRATYYWTQMLADAATTVRECSACAKNRVRLIKQATPMRLFPAERPLETGAIDILGPLPKSNDGFLFILMITDRFTKLTQAIPLKRIKRQ